MRERSCGSVILVNGDQNVASWRCCVGIIQHNHDTEYIDFVVAV